MFHTNSATCFLHIHCPTKPDFRGLHPGGACIQGPQALCQGRRGSGQALVRPLCPQAPVVEGADAAELQAYAEAPVDVEGQTNSKSASPQANDEDWLAFEEEEGVAV